ncbi:lipase family protein [Frankia nepalensis]|uniref:lipase family protein n=1 Tax=Frankia nepalensis TaxID=1836974 RepID=UPI00288998BC|nr:lipase family protein [Frankia nepalensis]
MAAQGRPGRRNARRLALAAATAGVLAVAPLAGCGLFGPVEATAPGASQSPSVEPLADVPPGAPGQLISAERLPGAADVLVWRVAYHTTDHNGADVAATGVVLAPASGPGDAVPAGGRPVVAFGHGTTGLADACAPSRLEPTLAALGATLSLVRAGYVVAAADYVGLGGPGEHAIYAARPEGQAMLDIARAARGVPRARAGSEVVAWGYSQGGQAALAAGALAATYAPDLDLRGVVAMAPLVDLSRSLRGLLQHNDSGVAYVLLAAFGVSVTRPGVRLDDELTAEGRRMLSVARQECAVDLLAASVGVSAADLFVTDPLTTEPFASAFAAQRTAVLRRMPPVLLIQGDADDVIGREVTDGVVRDLCATGTVVDYRRYPGAGHSTIFPASAGDMDAWIANLFAATSAPVHDIC